LYKSLKDTKLKITPTCFGSYAIHYQGVQSCLWLKLFVVVHRCLWCVCIVHLVYHWFKITLPNTYRAHDKRLWTTTNNFSQVQLYTPWWWIAYDPKHVGVIFNFVSFKLLHNVDCNL